jgi:hypothetical protein
LILFCEVVGLFSITFLLVSIGARHG